jgi:hypothetical protein
LTHAVIASKETVRKRDSLPWVGAGIALFILGIFPYLATFLATLVAYVTPPAPHLMARPPDAPPDAIRAVALRWEVIESSLVVAAILFLIQGYRVYLRSG